MTTPTQADRLAEQIKRALAAYEIQAHVQSSVSEDLASLAALAKQQASPAQPRLIGWRTADYLMETSDQKVAAGWQVHFTVLPIFEGDIHTKLATPPSAPQAAGAMECERCGESQQAHTPGGWCDNQSFVATQGAQVREQAALPAVDEYVNAKGFAVSEQWKRGFEHARMFLAQGTTPAAGVGEQSQAEPMSDERIIEIANGLFQRWQEDIKVKFVLMLSRAILAEAGIKEKT